MYRNGFFCIYFNFSVHEELGDEVISYINLYCSKMEFQQILSVTFLNKIANIHIILHN